VASSHTETFEELTCNAPKVIWKGPNGQQAIAYYNQIPEELNALAGVGVVVAFDANGKAVDGWTIKRGRSYSFPVESTSFSLKRADKVPYSPCGNIFPLMTGYTPSEAEGVR